MLLSRLQRDWDALARRPEAVERARAWFAAGTLLSLDDLLERAGHCDSVRQEGRDEALAALVAIARYDDLAARVVLQRMLPGLAAVAKRRTRSFSESLSAMEDLLAVAWSVIREFDLSRSSHLLAMRLVSDCEYRVFRASYRRCWTTQAMSHDDLDRLPRRGADDPVVALANGTSELDDVLSDACGRGLDPEDAELLRALAVTGSTKQLAERWQVTDRTIRNRRAAAVERVRELVLN
jgi:hypothetical protein